MWVGTGNSTPVSRTRSIFKSNRKWLFFLTTYPTIQISILTCYRRKENYLLCTWNLFCDFQIYNFSLDKLVKNCTIVGYWSCKIMEIQANPANPDPQHDSHQGFGYASCLGTVSRDWDWLQVVWMCRPVFGEVPLAVHKFFSCSVDL